MQQATEEAADATHEKFRLDAELRMAQANATQKEEEYARKRTRVNSEARYSFIFKEEYITDPTTSI